MPRQVVFPCPNCGASQSVEEGSVSTQCQFCGNTIAVPEELRPKTPPPNPAAPAYSFGNAPGLTVMPGVFLNMDVNKLKAMAMAARAGDKAEAARLYGEAFGVSPEDAMQAAELMATHHPVVLSQLQMGSPPMMQSGGAPPAGPYAPPGGIYPLPSPPVQSARGRRSGCFYLAYLLVIGLILLAPIITGIVYIRRGLFGNFGNVVNQAKATATRTPEPTEALLPTSAAINTQSPTQASIATPLATSTTVDPYPRVDLTFGGKGSGAGLFTDPRTIAVDGNGNIYVADYSDGRVQVFNPKGKFANQWKITEEKQPHVQGLAASRSGTVYVALSSGVYSYAGATGKPLGKLNYGGDGHFIDVAMRPNGGLAVTLFGASGDDVALFKSNGQVERVIADAVSTISGQSELDTKIAVDGNDNVFLLGTFSSAVFQYNAQGKYVNRFGSEGDQDGQLAAPNAIAVDGQGQVYVADIKGIQVFSPDGRFLSVFSVPGRAVVFGMTFDDQGALYAVSNDNKAYKFMLAPPK